MSGMASFLSGMAQGYGTVMDFADRAEARRERAEDRKMRQAQWEADQAEQKRQRERQARLDSEADLERSDLAAARAPIKHFIEEVPGAAAPSRPRPGPITAMPAIDMPDAAPQPAPPPMFKVGGKTFTARPDAEKAVAELDAQANAPMAVAQREAAAMRDPVRRQALLTGVQGLAAQQAQMEEIERARRARDAYTTLGGALFRQDAPALSQALTQQYNDGKTYRAVRTPKGEWQVSAEDGQGKVLGSQTFASTPGGASAEEAFLGHAMQQFDPAKWVDRETAERKWNKEMELKARQIAAMSAYRSRPEPETTPRLSIPDAARVKLLTKTIESVEQLRLKGMAEKGMEGESGWEPTKLTAGQRQLEKDAAKAEAELNDIYARYTQSPKGPDAQDAGPYPGLREPATKGEGATKPAGESAAKAEPREPVQPVNRSFYERKPAAAPTPSPGKFLPIGPQGRDATALVELLKRQGIAPEGVVYKRNPDGSVSY